MPDWYIPQASSYAGDVDFLILLISAIVLPWLLLSEGMFFWLLWRFRAREGQKAQYITGDEPQLKRWITVPHAIIIALDVIIIVGAINVWYKVKLQMPAADEVVRVTAQQWAWVFQHPGADGKLDTADDITVVDELHVVEGKTYHFELQSRDVLHSFFIPAFRLKQDMIPGRVITGWFKPTRAGEYDINCAEICGIGHGLMPAKLVVEQPAQHAAWIAEHNPGLASR